MLAIKPRLEQQQTKDIFLMKNLDEANGRRNDGKKRALKNKNDQIDGHTSGLNINDTRPLIPNGKNKIKKKRLWIDKIHMAFRNVDLSENDNVIWIVQRDNGNDDDDGKEDDDDDEDGKKINKKI